MNSDSIGSIKEQVDRRWQFLMAHAEDRHKLVIYGVNFYKTIQQVKLVLESLAKQYNSEEDFCRANSFNFSQFKSYDLLSLLTKVNTTAAGDEQSGEKKISQVISKHQEQKEAFLKACTLARRNAETFIKYANRCSNYNAGNQTLFRNAEGRVKVTLEQIHKEENIVMQCWTKRKRRLDQCQQFVLVEHSAKQALKWIRETGENWLLANEADLAARTANGGTNVHGTNVHGTSEDAGQAKDKHLKDKHDALKEFSCQVKETREKVRLLVQLCENLIERRHPHSDAIKFWSDKVAQFFTEFEAKLQQFEQALLKRLNHHFHPLASQNELKNETESLRGRPVACSSTCSSLEESNILKMTNLSLANDGDQANLTPIDPVQLELKQKSARKRVHVMGELLATERSYVQDLKICIEIYLAEYLKRNGRDSEKLFGNIRQIYDFHNKIFLKELEKYESMPEDVGHCFVTWARSFDIYVSYCKNKPDSNHLLVQTEISALFDELQKEHNIMHPIAAYLIKPIQRITKYQLLIKDLLTCSEQGLDSELRDALDVMMSVPKKANDAMHLSMLEGVDENTTKQLGEVILQDAFQVFDSKSLLPNRKGRERRVFLFESFILFAKETKETKTDGSQHNSSSQSHHNQPKSKYIYKNKVNTSDLGVTEHIEGDELRFAIWTNNHHNKIVLKSQSVETKLIWIKKLRELIQENTIFTSRLSTLNLSAAAAAAGKTKAGKESLLSISNDPDRLVEPQVADRNSIASYSSSNTTDSDKFR